MMIIAPNQNAVSAIISELNHFFPVKDLGPYTTFGMEIKRDENNKNSNYAN